MMIHAYSELYLNDAMTNVAELFNYVSDAESLDELFFLFIKKGYPMNLVEEMFIFLICHLMFYIV